MLAKQTEMKFKNLTQTGQYVQANKRFTMAIQAERKADN